jgi:hypothetical protein
MLGKSSRCTSKTDIAPYLRSISLMVLTVTLRRVAHHHLRGATTTTTSSSNQQQQQQQQQQQLQQ